ncbi:hypothetical protein RSOLAG22IIIB_08198 [Rhizoctonia solani]|uniref:Uncharacterized protein n=1 Tax=Rhizoctonia solani TaxID=456999 RepID=A0A0K6FRR6_9AGAM|nr:hypothetical protein RSOLAG22IIIB_08198 [Rhizoctonia solani]
MSDRDLFYSPEPASSSTRKRKSTRSSATQTTKKPRRRGKKAQPDPYQTAKGHVETVLADPESFRLPVDDQEIREMFATIDRYTKSLEGSVAVEVARIKTLITRGIKKLMTWKPSCKHGRAKYAFDGVCPDPRVFGTVFGLDSPPTWRAKKFTYAEFERYVGEIEGRARYSELVLTGDVNVPHNPETGEFKFSGNYGDSQSRYAREDLMRNPVNLNWGGGAVDEDE